MLQQTATMAAHARAAQARVDWEEHGLDPSLAGQASGWLAPLAAVVPVLTAVRALVFVVAVVVISRSDART